jgi:hypothetical protein
LRGRGTEQGGRLVWFRPFELERRPPSAPSKMSATKKRTLPSTGQGTDHDQADGNKRPFSKEEKGKGRVGNRSSADSRKLALSDVWEMATGVPKR